MNTYRITIESTARTERQIVLEIDDLIEDEVLVTYKKIDGEFWMQVSEVKVI